MKFAFWYSGASNPSYIEEGMEKFIKRINHYIPFEIDHLKLGKVKSPKKKAEKEKDLVLRNLKPADYLILLDENGQNFTSEAFSSYLQHLFNQGHQKIIFLAGGSHGFHEVLKQKADAQVALSQMTLNHEHVRLFFIEQVYRALTIIHNAPYHH